MSKSNPPVLKVGTASAYAFKLANTGSAASGTTINVYEQLPPQVAYSAAAPLSGGSVLPQAVNCSVVEGSVAAGQLLNCSVTLPSGGLPALNGTAQFSLSVLPQAAAGGTLAVNRARVDPSGANAAMSPTQCTYNGVPAGCAVTPALTVQNSTNLALSKTNPPSLLAGQAASYGLSLSNQGSGATGTSLVVYDQLPANLQYNSAAPVAGGSVTPTAVSCTATGTVAAGQLLSCTLSLPAGGLPPAGSARFSVSVTPPLASVGSALVNKAAIDPSGANAAQTPANCTAADQPTAGCALTPGLMVQASSLQLTVKSAVAGSFSLAGNNGWVTQTLQVPTAGQEVSGAVQGLNSASITTLNLSSSVTGLSIKALSCTGLGSGTSAGTASFTGLSLTLDAKATAAGNALVCTVTLGNNASLSLSKISLGGVGSFSFSGTNGWALQSLSTTTAGTPVQGAAQDLAALNTDTVITESLPGGWVLTGVQCVDSQSGISGNPASTVAATLLGGGRWQIPADYIRAGSTWSCTVTNSYGGFSISGMVLLDNGVGGGVAHDGVKNGAETGQAGVSLSLSDCMGKVYSSAISDGAGQFSLGTAGVPEGKVCVQQNRNPAKFDLVSVQGGTAGASYDPGNEALSLNLAASSHYTGLLFGNVPLSTLTGEGSQQLQPGQAATYAHTFMAGTSATVSVLSTDVPSVSGQSWRSVVYQDQNCNAQLDAGDSVMAPTQSLNVVAGQQVCLLVRVFSPVTALAGHSDKTQLWVFATYQPISSLGTRTWYGQGVDLSTISTSSAALVLLKQVRKVGNCPSAAADQQAFALSNQAAPGDFVEYLLTYSNGSSAPLTSILIQDAVPAYTQFRSAACGLPLPPGLQSCSVTQQPAVGSSMGSIQWTLKDAASSLVGLQPSALGTVLYCVQVQR